MTFSQIHQYQQNEHLPVPFISDHWIKIRTGTSDHGNPVPGLRKAQIVQSLGRKQQYKYTAFKT
jgi:hypothetical protein